MVGIRLRLSWMNSTKTIRLRRLWRKKMEKREIYTAVIVTLVRSKLRNPKVLDALKVLGCELLEEKAPARCIMSSGYDSTDTYDKVNSFLDEHFKDAQLPEYDCSKMEEKLNQVLKEENAKP
jgi:hypothetical protein